MNINPHNNFNYYSGAEGTDENKEDGNEDCFARQPSWVEWGAQAQPSMNRQGTNTHIPPHYHPAFAEQSTRLYGVTGGYSDGHTSASSHTAIASPTPLRSETSDYGNAINTLLSGSTSTRSREEIIHRVNIAHGITSMEEKRNSQKELMTSDSHGMQHIQVEGTYDPRNNTYTVENTERQEYTKINISDALLTQLSHAMPKDNDNLPTSLPEKIKRASIMNDVTQAVIDKIFKHLKPDTPVITLPLQQNAPKSLTNQYLYELLTETPNGKSTAYTISNFNKAQDKECTIKEVEVSKTIVFGIKNYHLTFTIAETDR